MKCSETRVAIGHPECLNRSRRRPAPPTAALFATIFLVLAGFALSLDLPKTKLGFQGDEATYYSLGHSLARDLDFTFERRDLVRVWDEFPGPEGIFLKQGKTIDLQRTGTFPYLRLVRTPDPRPDRLYYGKSYIYPLIAAPFVRVFGTNGFLVLHAVLMTLNILAAYTFLRARRSSAGTALAYAVVFFGASIVPVYFVSLSPELLNVSLVLYAFCLWSLKETAAEGAAGGALAARIPCRLPGGGAPRRGDVLEALACAPAVSSRLRPGPET